ncbi:hypothetical protein [Phenylobacterium sp.]|uniref:terminase small subunit-like protein n=1 Tax=Phenylobacterium sp. TaxID=1871053 RepID=UPI0025D9F33E|nr:hypothetical protein [Phenylobacterium sp.]
MRRNFDPADRQRLLDALFERRFAGETFEQICATPGWPTRPTLRRWLREGPGLAEHARACRRVSREPRERFAFDPRAAEELLRRIRFGEPLGRLIREPHLPQRRALNAWKAANPLFAAELAAAKAFADPQRRRYGRRRARPCYDDEALADRIVLALIRGATLPLVYRDPALPTPLGLRRWRKADPEFDQVIRGALVFGHQARGRARTEALCTPALTQAIELGIVEGASLASLGARPELPSVTTLYKWVRDRPAFAQAVARACEFRDEFLYRDAVLDLAERRGPAAATEINALHKRLGQLNPHPGARRRGP